MAIPAKQTIAIGGIEAHVYSDPSGDIPPSCPLAVLFLLHGRTRSVADLEPIANRVVQETRDRRIQAATEGGKQLDVIVVAFVSASDYLHCSRIDNLVI